jgi:hypothetical protein
LKRCRCRGHHPPLKTSPAEVQCRSLVRLFAGRWHCPVSNLC